MTLERLVLHNYMIHRDMDACLDGNLIALTGEMGRGKSTFVGAIQFCLTGEHPPWTRDDLLSWGADEGSAQLFFSHDGKDCVVTRKLHKNEAVLLIGEERVSGIRNVEAAMAERIGVDKDILRQIGFVQQGDIQAILFSDPAKREAAFQRLIGIGAAKKIFTELGPIIQSYTVSENFDASIASLRKHSEAIRMELESVEKALKADEDALGLLPSRESLQEESEKLAATLASISSLESSRKNVKTLWEKIDDANRKMMSASATRKSLEDSLGCTVQEMENYVASLRVKAASADASLENMRKLTSASSEDGECPLCGSKVEPGQVSRHVSKELSRLASESASARSEYEETRAAFDSVKRSMENASRTIESMNRTIAVAEASIASEKELQASVLGRFAELMIPPDGDAIGKAREETERRLTETRSTIANLSSLTMAVSSLRGEKNAKQSQLASAVKMLDEKEREKELNGPVARKVEVLQRVRNWFHASNGPRTMSTSAVDSMTGYVNEYLEALESEVHVYADRNGLGFTYSYNDGRPVSDPLPSTEKLSGGQKIELALAFRLAIYRYFGQRMGIMVLDEPTAHLSPSGITRFGELLQTVGGLARNMNLQILMPTHEKEIMPYMDSEIHFG